MAMAKSICTGVALVILILRVCAGVNKQRCQAMAVFIKKEFKKSQPKSSNQKAPVDFLIRTAQYLRLVAK